MKVLPLGSVVTLKNAKEPAKFMIVARNGLLSKDDVVGYMDYVACLYPVGFQDKTHYFNQEDIEEVLFVGYVDNFEQKYQDGYESRMEKIQSKYPKLKLNHKAE